MKKTRRINMPTTTTTTKRRDKDTPLCGLVERAQCIIKGFFLTYYYALKDCIRFSISSA